MDNRNLRQRLFDSGLLESGASSKEISEFKKRFRADYVKEYNRSQKEKTHRKTLIFTNEQMGYLNEQAKKHHMRLSPFLTHVIFSYLEGYFVFPSSRQLTAIEKHLRDINNRIAQSIQYVHLSRDITYTHIQEIKTEVTELQNYLSDKLDQPPTLEVWIKDQMGRDDQFLSKLLFAIAKYINQ